MRSVLHELAVEDAKSFHLRPKVEEYESGVQLGSRPTVRPSMPSRRKPVPGASTRPQPAPRAVNRWIDGLEDSLRPRRAPAPQMSGGARFAAGDGAAAQSVCGAANLGCVGGAPVGSGIDGPVL